MTPACAGTTAPAAGGYGCAADDPRLRGDDSVDIGSGQYRIG